MGRLNRFPIWDSDREGQYIYTCHIGINNIFFIRNGNSGVLKSNLYYVEHVKQPTFPEDVTRSYF